MIIDCIADIHGFKPKLPGGDLLILAGDYTSRDKLTEWAEFFKWVKDQPYQKKVLIAGNHDNVLEKMYPKTASEAKELAEVREFLEMMGEEKEDFEYLCDSGTEFCGMDKDLKIRTIKIWGTPWTPWFHGVNPKCKAFMDSEGYLKKRFSLIPDNLDILITHGPMLHILDNNIHGYACGSISLRDAIDRARPRFHVFGHIHEQGGNQIMYKHQGPNTWCVNCSYVNENYKPLFNYVRLEI